MENKHSLYLTLVFLLLAYSTTANKGMTFQATIWPQAQNNWTGQMGCNGCDPYQGDTDC